MAFHLRALMCGSVCVTAFYRSVKWCLLRKRGSHLAKIEKIGLLWPRLYAAFLLPKLVCKNPQKLEEAEFKIKYIF